MAFKLVLLAAFVASASAGFVPKYANPEVKYSDASEVSYSSLSSPVFAQVQAPVVAKYAAPTVTYGAPAAYAAPVAKVSYSAPVVKEIYAEPDTPAQYNFEYSVNDEHTGDIKTQQESREGNVVHGSYYLVEPDGSRRIVEYTADDVHGFNAVVRKEPADVKAVAPVAKFAYAPVTKVAVASPVVAKYHASAVPAYHAPVSSYYHH